MLCHGQGDLNKGGCCYVNGDVCPLRWDLRVNEDTGVRHLYASDGTDLGPVEDYIRSVVKGRGNQDRAIAQTQAIRWACRAAVEVLASDSRLLTDRQAFADAWNAHPEYQAKVRIHWEALEDRLGLPAGSYQCSNWRGTDVPQCCFAEDVVTNETKASSLHSDAKNLRQAGGS